MRFLPLGDGPGAGGRPAAGRPPRLVRVSESKRLNQRTLFFLAPAVRRLQLVGREDEVIEVSTDLHVESPIKGTVPRGEVAYRHSELAALDADLRRDFAAVLAKKCRGGKG